MAVGWLLVVGCWLWAFVHYGLFAVGDMVGWFCGWVVVGVVGVVGVVAVVVGVVGSDTY